MKEESSVFLQSRRIFLLPFIGLVLSLLACGTQPAEDSSVMSEAQSTADSTCLSLISASDRNADNNLYLREINDCFEAKYSIRIRSSGLDKDQFLLGVRSLQEALTKSEVISGSIREISLVPANQRQNNILYSTQINDLVIVYDVTSDEIILLLEWIKDAKEEESYEKFMSNICQQKVEKTAKYQHETEKKNLENRSNHKNQ
jgi:hypothetical protein